MKDKFEIKNLLTEKHRADRRFYIVQRARQFLSAFVLGTIAGALFGCYLSSGGSISIGSPEVVKQTIEVKAVNNEPKRYCDSPIDYIRCSGEDLGKSNKEISIMINIAKKESNMNPKAKNKSSSASGLFQIIAGTWYSNDCVGDKWNFKDNTDCAWKIQGKRDFQPWEVCTLGLVNCK